MTAWAEEVSALREALAAPLRSPRQARRMAVVGDWTRDREEEVIAEEMRSAVRYGYTTRGPIVSVSSGRYVHREGPDGRPTKRGRRIDPATDRVLAILRAAGRPMRYAEVAQIYGCCAANARFALELRAARGMVRRVAGRRGGRGGSVPVLYEIIEDEVWP